MSIANPDRAHPGANAQTAMKSVLFYSDAAEYGGHEAMTVEAVRHLCGESDLKVYFAFYSGNTRLREKLEAVRGHSESLVLLPLPVKAKTLQAIRSLISWRQVARIEAVMRRVNPDVVVVSQGRIEGSSMGLLAAKHAGCQVISYLPVAHPVSVSGRRFAVSIRERINRYFYQLPDKIITISESSRRMLSDRGATPNVVVVPNSVETPPIHETDRQRFRERHGIERHEYVVATIGRISFRDKGQDFALRSLSRFRLDLRDYKFVFVGHGPDEERFKIMITDFELSRQVRLLPWTPHPTEIYAGIDMVMIPSRFEGVPLVMLEAMAYGLPIVATDVDGMAEFLPHEWLFPFGDCKALSEALLRVRNDDNSRWLELHRHRIADEFTVSNFRDRLIAAICG